MQKSSRIYIAGIKGLVGSAIAATLRKKGFTNIEGHVSKDLDFTDQAGVNTVFKIYKPEYIFIAAAKVGGIHANNTYPADFIFSNLCIQNNLINASYIYGVKKLLFLGSSCVYPKYAPQPISENSLLASALEPTNEPYAVAKIAGIKMCEAYNRQYGTNFITCMPTNLYGRNDNYDVMNAHVLPALIRKIHEAKERMYPSYTVWGTGSPRREFLFSDDLADACIFLMENYDENRTINIGSGQEVSIKELALITAEVIGYKGDIVFDKTKPDGTPRKLLDVSRLKKLGWEASTPLKTGIRIAYEDFCNSKVRM